MEEEDGRTDRVRAFHELRKRRHITSRRLKNVIGILSKKGWINSFAGSPVGVNLTPAGRKEAKRLVRVHRLWEQYLNQHLQIAEDHVHDDAESMEHLITEDIESQLRHSLGSPAMDPHKSSIPYEDSGKPESHDPDHKTNPDRKSNPGRTTRSDDPSQPEDPSQPGDSSNTSRPPKTTNPGKGGRRS